MVDGGEKNNGGWALGEAPWRTNRLAERYLKG